MGWWMIGLVTAQAYEIDVPLFAAPVHEALSHAAQTCLEQAAPGLPGGCDRPGDWLQDAWKAPPRNERRRWARAVRWADNPTRNGIGAVPLTQWGGCQKRIEAGELPSSTGLLCEGHYGALQFFHAQPSVDRDATGRPQLDEAQRPSDAVTAERIVGWALFAWDHAVGNTTGPLSTVLDERYPASFVASMRSAVPSTWAVEDLFTRHCSPGSLADCHDSFAASREIALGAVLHVIQDSWSASHVTRVAQEGTPQARVFCAAPQAYHRYQDDPRVPEDEHGDADRWPTWDAGCEGRVGPVTASARALHHAQAHSADDDRREAFEHLMRVDVLGLPAR